jgi:hypothetical protein
MPAESNQRSTPARLASLTVASPSLTRCSTVILSASQMCHFFTSLTSFDPSDCTGRYGSFEHSLSSFDASLETVLKLLVSFAPVDMFRDGCADDLRDRLVVHGSHGL